MNGSKDIVGSEIREDIREETLQSSKDEALAGNPEVSERNNADRHYDNAVGVADKPSDKQQVTSEDTDNEQALFQRVWSEIDAPTSHRRLLRHCVQQTKRITSRCSLQPRQAKKRLNALKQYYQYISSKF